MFRSFFITLFLSFALVSTPLAPAHADNTTAPYFLATPVLFLFYPSQFKHARFDLSSPSWFRTDPRQGAYPGNLQHPSRAFRGRQARYYYAPVDTGAAWR